MAILELTVASGELSVRRFVVREAVSSLFSVSVWARSPDPSLDLGAMLDRPATFHSVSGYLHVANRGARTWKGIVVDAEQVYALQPAVGQEGLSTYFCRIVPDLYRLTQRRGNRIFQHLSIPDIVDKLLAEWSIERVWKIDRGRYPKLEYKVQYAESDYDFFSRLLEEGGIAFTFPEDEDGKLTMSDRLESNPLRSGPHIGYVDHPSQAAEQEFVTAVRLGREVRPGAFSIRDHEFRNPDFPLFGEAPRAGGSEDRYEQYHFDQGGFLVETGKGGGTPVADDKGIARHDQKYGKDLAERFLHGERAGIRGASFEANTFDLAPGVIFSMDRHPHPELSTSRKVLVLETTFEGTPEGEWTLSGHTIFADAPYHPPRRTPKPVVHGLQSATVVGPKGQEIHTDEFGRVRVQFHWDREGSRDDESSCWIRVNQGWGGMGYGMIVLPRIAQEVLVGFAEGDPDLPFVMGRAYNAIQQVPYRLPEHKTRSTWKSDSSLGSNGFNEIMFEDLAKKELVWQQAEKDRTRLVKNDEFATVVHDRQKLVKRNESEHTDGLRKRWVGKDLDVVTIEHKREQIQHDCHVCQIGDVCEDVIGTESLTIVDDRHERVDGSYAVESGSGVHVTAGEHFVAEGETDVTLAGPGGFIRISAEGVTIEGTMVKINVSGAPGKGPGAHPAPPEEPRDPKESPSTPAKGKLPKGCEYLKTPELVTAPKKHFDRIRSKWKIGKARSVQQLFVGATAAADAIAHDITIKGTVVTVIAPTSGVPTRETVPSIKQMARSLAAVPKQQMKTIKTVVLNPNRNPDDSYWAEQYDTPDFRSAATGGAGGVTYYPLPMYSGGKSPWHQAEVDRVMVHEGGHTYSDELWKKPKLREQWQKAIDGDKPKVPSKYAKSAIGEDFSESLVMYTLSKGTKCEAAARKRYGHRYRVLDKLFKQAKPKKSTPKSR